MTLQQQQQHEQRKEEIKGFQAWLQSMSWEHFRDCSSIVYSRDSQAQNFKNNNNHHELDLLREMLDLQPPPPTPIHARAIPYRPVAARDPCTDGRNQDERNFKGRFQRPCWFQWEESGRLAGKRNGVTHYRVYQKRFVQPDGAVYTLGCTERQRSADEELLRMCLFVEPISSESATYIQIEAKASEDPRRILRILHVVSRGGFASASPSKTNSQSPWLDPTQRWFSLPMFLASRFELALWKSYREDSPKIQPWPRTLVKELTATKISAIVSAVAVRFWKQQLQTTRESIPTLMDSVLWKLLMDRHGRVQSSHQHGSQFSSSKALLESLVRFPLVAPFDSKILREFRQEAKDVLYQEFLKATERSLMLLDSLASPERRTNKAALKKSKRRNKKKPALKTSSMFPSSTATDDVSNPNSDGSQVSQEGKKGFRSVEIELDSCIDYPENGTSARDRNRNIVMALGIMDTILNRVYTHVGLDPDTDTFEVEETVMPLLSDTVRNGSAVREPEKEELLHINDTIEMSNISEGDGNVTRMPEVSTLPQSFAAHHVEEYSSYAYQQFDNSGVAIGLSERDLDVWSKQIGFVHRSESLLVDFFQSQKDAATREEQIEASSTAASLASSCTTQHLEASFSKDFASDESQHAGLSLGKDVIEEVTHEDETEKVAHGSFNEDTDTFIPLQESERVLSQPSSFDRDIEGTGGVDDESLSPPSTPSPRLSPILITLSDISRMQKASAEPTKLADASKICVNSISSAAAHSVSAKSEPKPMLYKTNSSRSIDGVRKSGGHENEKKISKTEIAPLSPSLGRARQTLAGINRARDDQDIRMKGNPRKSVDVLASYRNVVLRPLTSRDDYDIGRVRTGPKSLPYRAALPKAPARSISYSKTTENTRSPFSHFQIEAGWWKDKSEKKNGAQSDTTFDIHDNYQNWPDLRQSLGQDDGDNNTKDGSTTITSNLSIRDTEDVSALREERDAYRDMCLTLGAEVAKLKNVLATQKSLFTPKPTPARGTFGLTSGPFDPQMTGSHVFERFPFARSHTAMSDAGFRADYESQASEDEGAARIAYTDNSRQLSSVATRIDSDTSVDRTTANMSQMGIVAPPVSRYGAEPSYFQGMRSRLTNDMLRFLQATDLHLKKQEPIKAAAIVRMTRLVNTMWPRAQVKLYGSNVTRLSLPTSDLDFVICLPAVHKKAVAVAPGVLEGRNAINESSQKLLARTLKGESWIDPRSMKLIERTVVPVIKVSTKDTKARSLQLDITFDSPGHHGIEANQMVTSIMDELPVIRPLLLVLKQFLSNRGLLTAYTGGLSAYGLFLMVARYLQEQESWGDCGSLLMGFLDFYGNNFDPRSTGISVKNRQYFSRLAGPTHPTPQSVATNQATWRPMEMNSIPTTQFFRRYSFSDKGNIDAHRGANPSVIIQPAIPLPVPTNSNSNQKSSIPPVSEMEHSAMPYTLDPMLIEDPLNESNNVGRNAFRIFSVLRAFSDAHRALMASLEWDLHSNTEFQDDSEYPLLKCLLQNEDVVFNDIGR